MQGIIPQPENSNRKVWRYIDLPKLISTLNKNTLYFPRADQLKDPHEGSLTKVTSQYWRETLENKGLIEAANALSKLYMKARFCTYISCWTMNEYESEAMWKLYCPNDQGVAIQTTYQKLKDSIKTEIETVIGQVQYLDYDRDSFQYGSTLYPFIFKRISFSYENEIRAIKQISEGFTDNNPKLPIGIEVKWDFVNTIEGIYINPYAEEWFSDVVKSVVDKYIPKFKLKIQWSNIKSMPQY